TVISVSILVGWFAFQAALQRFAPGRWVRGVPLSDGRQLAYRMNGWFSWWFTWACLVVCVALGWIEPARLYDHIRPLFTTANVFTFALAAYLYAHGRGRPDDGSRACSGSFSFDYFVGTSRNPRIGTFDWKLFCEARPGLIGWVVLDLAYAAKQRE